MERTVTQKKKKLQQIARRNGVSLSTVYRIQRGSGSQKNPKFQSVRQEIRLLQEDRSDIPGNPVLMVAENDLTAHALEFYEQMKRICFERKIELVLTFKKYLARDLAARTYSGIISLITLDSPPAGIPLVYLNRRSRTGLESSVSIDTMVNWTLMLDHLRKTGSKRIGIFTPVAEMLPSYYLVAGCTQANLLQELAGLPEEPELICVLPLDKKTHTSVLPKVGDYFASMKELPDTLLLSSDIYAPRVVKRLRDHGIRIPEDLLLASVTSYLRSVPSSSDETAYALREEYLEIDRIPLVYGSFYFKEMARDAFELLLEKINHPEGIARVIGYTLKLHDYRFEKKENESLENKKLFAKQEEK